MAWFSCATRRPISHNVGGSCAPIGVLMHQQVGYGSLYGFFGNPSAGVSAHFWISRSGLIEQYVDTVRAAWHATDLNGSYCGIEFEGRETDAITQAQIDAGGRLLAEGLRVHGWPLQLANAKGQRGFGYHRLPGSGNRTACPSDLRLSTRPAMLQRAGGGGGAAPAPPAPKPPATAPKPPAPPPSGGAPPWPGRVLKQPPVMSGNDVRQWQQQMKNRGWAITVDGAYGPSSERVCRSFQSEKRLAVDGQVGPQTWSATWTAPVT